MSYSVLQTSTDNYAPYRAHPLSFCNRYQMYIGSIVAINHVKRNAVKITDTHIIPFVSYYLWKDKNALNKKRIQQVNDGNCESN